MREKDDEWRTIETLLPTGWIEKATELKAFDRNREFTPGQLLRVLLFHAVNDAGTRATAAQAAASGIASVSGEALRKRIVKSGDWLAWIGGALSTEFTGSMSGLPQGFRPRAVDSSTIQGPGAKGTEYRLHYSIDLRTLHCDWHEVTTAKGAELLERTTVVANDVLIGDRNYFRSGGVRPVVKAGAHVLTRLKSRHSALQGEDGQPFRTLDHAVHVRLGEVTEWPVALVPVGEEDPIKGRVIVTPVPAPIAQKNEQKARRIARRKKYKLGSDAILGTKYFMVFTTIGSHALSKEKVLELYRFRWQIEVAFKRLKQILRLGRLPHKDPDAACAWIQAKMVVALLLEKIYRQARSFSPWGYDLDRLDR